MSATAAALSAEAGSYFDPRFKTQALKILPGEYRVDDRDVMLVTVLGSCVAACLYDPLRRVGGMNHFMLPEAQDESSTWGTTNSTRYGAFAMEMLINDLLKRGASKARLQAKLFGGGAVLPGLTTTNVGDQNAVFALHYMAAEHIPVIGQDLGDVCPRRVHYFPASGRVMVKRLPAAHTRSVADEERQYRQSLQQQPKTGSVELF
ncbi:MAG TPA: chemoreceptor glutamine deamidase CheD [Nevskiaceae bacterium]|nr:chemoreceptor glutamine deamidase CheD [Nevskiaceae bacterium]